MEVSPMDLFLIIQLKRRFEFDKMTRLSKENYSKISSPEVLSKKSELKVNNWIIKTLLKFSLSNW